MKIRILCLFTLLLVGCGTISQQSIYEGIRSQQKVKDVGVEPKSQLLPSYDQYKEERNEKLKK